MRIVFKPELFRSSFLKCLLEYSRQHAHFVILNSNGASEEYDILAGFGRRGNVNEFRYFNSYPDLWKFGYFGYDLKNKFEELSSSHRDRIKSTDIEFFVPEIVICLKGNLLEITSNNETLDRNTYDILRETSLGKRENASPFNLTASYPKT